MPPAAASLSVSIVIPARDAAETIAETLASVGAQTWTAWEVIVVDDGSTDATPRVVAGWSARDPRIRLVGGPRRPSQGVSAARNLGIRHSRHGVLLFLDADDTIDPGHLAALTGALAADGSAAAAISGWGRVAPDGVRGEGYPALPSGTDAHDGDLFAALARASLFPIHACAIRRPCVEEAGGFDESLRTCEDWDLWQRVARTGARFVTVAQATAWYRMRPASASIDGRQMLVDGLLAQQRGHASDPRVRAPLPAHANGAPAANLALVEYCYACWPAGLVLGAGRDACALLDALAGVAAPDLDPGIVAQTLADAMVLPRCLRPGAAASLWPDAGPLLERFLAALERQSGSAGLARRAQTRLEALVIRRAAARTTRIVGRTQAVTIDLAAAVPDVDTAEGVERLLVTARVDGRAEVEVELPVMGRTVPGAVVVDAVVADAVWPLLGAFLARAVYARGLEIRSGGDGCSVWRGSQCLARDLDGRPEAIPVAEWLHQTVGWTVFLQELWSRPSWSLGDFYDPDRQETETGRPGGHDGAPRASEAAGVLRPAPGDPVWIEVSADLPAIDAPDDPLWIGCLVAGVPLGWMSVPNPSGHVDPQRVRAAVTTAGGLELCRLAVREGVACLPLDAPGTLRDRLAARAAAPRHRWHGGATLGRHPQAPLGSGPSRRAMLPAASLASIRALAEGHHQAFRPDSGDIGYAPEVLSEAPPAPDVDEPLRVPRAATAYDRHHFESLFAATADPWTYRSDYERRKYQQTLDLIPAGAARVLELACAEGDFTVALAARVGHVVAADISELALQRTAARCAHLGNVTCLRLDIAEDALPSGLDVIVCSEVLYYIGLSRLPDVARKLSGALAPGGRLVLAHANLRVDAPGEPGFDWNLPYGGQHIARTVASVAGLRFLRERRARHYRIQVFARETPAGGSGPALEPETIEAIESVEPIPRVAATFRTGAEAARPAEIGEAVTERLPILMYHRVAPSGGAALAQYRVTPEAFARQLAYLADNGFYTVTPDQWRRRAVDRRPLPGRAVMLTFDDGYRDFADHAWPLLQRHGFGATVFLVSERVGGVNEWDAAAGERLPLLDWRDARRLASEGVAFGSHAATHRRLTSLPPTDVADELLRSRASLEAGLGRSVTSVAYPYGDRDRVVEHLAGAAGYVFGFSCRPGKAAFDAPLLSLPRVEVMGGDAIEAFIAKV